MSQKVMTLRLPEDLAKTLMAVASVDGMPIAEAARRAINGYVTERCSDATFREVFRTRIVDTHATLFGSSPGDGTGEEPAS